jgi:hypothetical protein
MSAIKNTIARKAVKATAKHTARGAASKAKRNPPRAVTLLGIGAALGALAGWMAARSAAGPVSASTGS